MSQAFYSEKKGGHFGLNYDCYTHFTSPIRRYPDLDVHRKIKSVISNTKLIDQNLDELAISCSRQERNSEKASRFVQGWLSALVAQSHIREEFDGTVTSVVSFGCFVNIDAINVEGLVHVTDLGGDYFYYDSVMGILVGEQSGLQLYPGVALRVEITKADIESGQISLRLSKQGKRVSGRRK
jgi:ribonuclease R